MQNLLFFSKKRGVFPSDKRKMSKMTNVQKRVLTINREYVSYLRSSLRSVLQSLPLLIFAIFLFNAEPNTNNKIKQIMIMAIYAYSSDNASFFLTFSLPLSLSRYSFFSNRFCVCFVWYLLWCQRQGCLKQLCYIFIYLLLFLFLVIYTLFLVL